MTNFPIEIDTGVYVRPDDVSSIEDHEYWRNSGPSDSYIEDYGCRIILKNGLKIYIKKLMAIDVHDKLFPPIKDIVPSPDSQRLIMCNVNEGETNG